MKTNGFERSRTLFRRVALVGVAAACGIFAPATRLARRTCGEPHPIASAWTAAQDRRLAARSSARSRAIRLSSQAPATSGSSSRPIESRSRDGAER